MQTDNYYVRYHEITDTQTKPIRTSKERQDDGYSRMDAINQIVQLVRDTIQDTPSAEIIVNVSADKGLVIGFGETDQITSLDDK